MYEQNVLSGHNKVIQAHVQSRATGIEDKGHHVLRAVVGARPDLRIALSARLARSALVLVAYRCVPGHKGDRVCQVARFEVISQLQFTFTPRQPTSHMPVATWVRPNCGP